MPTANRRGLAALLLAALIGPLAGCQVALSTLTGLHSRSSSPSSAAAEPVEPASGPAGIAAPSASASDGPTSAPDDEPVADDAVGIATGEPDPAPAEEVVYAQPPPQCHSVGRGEFCDGVCMDTLVTADHCGACWIHCHEGNYCDNGQCKRPDGEHE